MSKSGACAILFTDKDRTAHLTRSLAHQYEGKVGLGEVVKANKELAQQFNISGSVTLQLWSQNEAAFDRMLCHQPLSCQGSLNFQLLVPRSGDLYKAVCP